MAHDFTFQIMNAQAGTSSVLHNPSIDNIKYSRVLDTLAVTPEGRNFQPDDIKNMGFFDTLSVITEG